MGRGGHPRSKHLAQCNFLQDGFSPPRVVIVKGEWIADGRRYYRLWSQEGLLLVPGAGEHFILSFAVGMDEKGIVSHGLLDELLEQK